MLSGSLWASTYASHQSDAEPISWCEANNTFSLLFHCTTWSFFSTVLSQSSASMGSTECEKVGGLVLWKSASLSLYCSYAACWFCCLLARVYCMLIMLCFMVWSIWACVTTTYSRVGGGGGLAALLFLASLFSVLVLRLLVLTILNDRWDKQERG
jgi:hypothetical protein